MTPTRTRDDEAVLVGRLQDRRPTTIAALLAFAALALGSLHAGERVPVQRPTQDDSITTAGRQLDVVKSNSANAANAAGGSALPQIVVPQVQPSAESPVPSAAIVAPQDPSERARSPNWLVDAMMKADDRKPGDRPRDLRDRKPGRAPDKHVAGDREDDVEHPADSATPTTEPRARDRHETSETSDTASPAAATDPAFNPLARYMAGWLAPQDYALLRRTLEAPSSGPSRAGEGPSATPSPADTPTAAGATDLFSAFGGTGTRDAGATEKPAANPYLEALTLPAGPPPVQAPPPAFVPEPTPVPQLAAPETAPRPIIPPFVRPASDDKYFKPLKRF